jgi:calcineurin-like phosphoesterase family protein
VKFFTADLHFGHKNVIPYCERPFASLDEMESELMRRWNAIVAPWDEVFILGDFSFHGSTKTAEILSRLHGLKILVRGNHDDVKSDEKAKRLGFFQMVPGGRVIIEGREFAVSHYPYLGEGDSTEVERFTSRRLSDQGNWLLHGHVHREWKVKKRMINVGVDMWDYAPVSEGEILSLAAPPHQPHAATKDKEG